MTSDSQIPERARSRNLQVVGFIAAGVLFLVIAVVYAYATGFSYFATYDDEGYMMLGLRTFLNGGILYNDVPTFYGPFYYFYEWVFHFVSRLPVTHDVTRALCIAHWLLASSLLAWACGRITRSVPAALFVFMQAVLHLTALAREPGHPQELAVLLLALAVLVATREPEQRWTLPALATIGVALVFTKINIGAFYGLALLLACMCYAPSWRSHQAWFWALLALSGLAPVMLMKPRISEEWVWIYAVLISASVLAAGAAGYHFARKPQVDFTKLVPAALVSLGISTIFLVVLLVTGTSFACLVDNLVTGPAKLGTAFCLPLLVPHCSWSALAALGAAVAVMKLGKTLGPAWLTFAKALYGAVGAVLLVTNFNAQLGYLLPWTWLVVVPITRDGQPLGVQHSFARAFLCLAAVWQGLQAYPVAGTQTAIATVLPILTYSLCLHDAITALAAQPRVATGLHAVSRRTTELLQTLVVMFLLYIFATRWCNPFSAWHYYTSVPRLALSGAEHLRLPENQVRVYQTLAGYLSAESDTFITMPGLNSLYFWAHKPPPTCFNISEVVLLTESQQSRVIAALEAARRPLIVVNPEQLGFSVTKGPLRDLIDRRCREVIRFGDFHIFELIKPEKPFLTGQSRG
jgi:hypothetical protein